MGNRARVPMTRDRRALFLDALREGRTVKDAAVVCGVRRQRLYELRNDHPGFKEEWDAAHDEGTDVLVAEAQRRAVDGVDKPVFQKGEQVGVVREYSDRLLEILLRARRPAEFRDNARVEHTGAGGRPLVAVEHDHAVTVGLLRGLADAGLIAPGPALVDRGPVRELPAALEG